jgi:hypothetical protein
MMMAMEVKGAMMTMIIAMMKITTRKVMTMMILK